MNCTPEKKTILLVEDHLETREILSSLLAQSGMEIISAADGVEALDAILKKMPDLILTDMRMPNMDGLELSRLVKNTVQYRHIPIILVSATPPNKNSHPEIAMFIQKPCSVSDLIDAISQHL